MTMMTGTLKSLCHGFSTKKKVFKCSSCPKEFAKCSALKTHIYSHTGEKPFKCSILACSKAFSTLSNLRRHIKTHTLNKERQKPRSKTHSARTKAKPEPFTAYQFHSGTKVSSAPPKPTVSITSKRIKKISSSALYVTPSSQFTDVSPIFPSFTRKLSAHSITPIQDISSSIHLCHPVRPEFNLQHHQPSLPSWPLSSNSVVPLTPSSPWSSSLSPVSSQDESAILSGDLFQLATGDPMQITGNDLLINDEFCSLKSFSSSSSAIPRTEQGFLWFTSTSIHPFDTFLL